MKLVGSAAGCDHDFAASCGAVLRFITRGHHLHLTHHVGRIREIVEGDHAALGHGAFLHADAIQDGFIAHLQSAIDS